MNCEQAANLFDAYLDGELSSGLATELAAHRVRCSACRRALALMEVSGHVISADVDHFKLDDAFTNRLVHCLGEAAPSKPRYGPWLRIGGGVLATAACALLVFRLFGGPETKVAGVREPGNEHKAEPPAQSEGTTRAGVNLDEAADLWSERLERGISNTQKSIDQLNELGERSLFRLIGSLDDDGESPAKEPATNQDSPEPTDSTTPSDDDGIEDL